MTIATSPHANMRAVTFIRLDVGVAAGADDAGKAEQAQHHDHLANHKKFSNRRAACAAIGEGAIAVPV